MLNVYTQIELKFNPEPIGLITVGDGCLYRVDKIITNEEVIALVEGFENNEDGSVMFDTTSFVFPVDKSFIDSICEGATFVYSYKTCNVLLIYNPFTKNFLVCNEYRGY